MRRKCEKRICGWRKWSDQQRGDTSASPSMSYIQPHIVVNYCHTDRHILWSFDEWNNYLNLSFFNLTYNLEFSRTTAREYTCFQSLHVCVNLATIQYLFQLSCKTHFVRPTVDLRMANWTETCNEYIFNRKEKWRRTEAARSAIGCCNMHIHTYLVIAPIH